MAWENTQEAKIVNDTEENKRIVTALFDLALNQQDFEKASPLLSPTYTYNGEASSGADNRAWVISLHAAYPGLHFSFDEILAENDLVALRWRMTAPAHKDRPAGYRTGTNILRVADGQVQSNVQNGSFSNGWPEHKS